MKKLLILALCAVMSGSFLVGCGGDEAESTGSSNTEVTEEVGDEEAAEDMEDEYVDEEEGMKLKDLKSLDMDKLVKETFADAPDVEKLVEKTNEFKNRVISTIETLDKEYNLTFSQSFESGELSIIVDFESSESIMAGSINAQMEVDDEFEYKEHIMVHDYTNKDTDFTVTPDFEKAIILLIPELDGVDFATQIEAEMKRLKGTEDGGKSEIEGVDGPVTSMIVFDPSNEGAEHFLSIVRSVY